MKLSEFIKNLQKYQKEAIDKRKGDPKILINFDDTICDDVEVSWSDNRMEELELRGFD